MVRAFLSFFRFIVGVALLPACVFVSKVLVELFSLLAEKAGNALIPLPLLTFCIGFVCWLFVYFFLPRPIRSYVLAHELTHAIWGLVMGARVSKLQVRGDGGSVTLSKSNIWITLAPYFFPFYTALVIIIYLLLSCFWENPNGHYVWLWLLGFTWGFHCTFTVSSLLQHQTDVQEYGYVLSYALIYFLNALEVCVGIVAVSSLTLEQFMSQCVMDYGWTKHVLGVAFHVVATWVENGISHLQ